MNLRDLAKTLGLSQTTVSRALNGYPEVAEDTRARIQEAARRHNYHPNTRAQSLATGRAMAIGHIIPLSSSHEMMNPVFADFIAGAGATYSANGYEMVLSVVRPEDELAAYRDMAARRSVDGVIVHGPRLDDPRPAALEKIGLPFVVHGRVPGIADGYDWMDMNNRRAFLRATEFLIELGHRRIGLINGHEFMDFAIRRRNGYLAALQGAGLPVDPALMVSGEMTEAHGHLSLSAMLALPDPPTAVLTSSIVCALGARRALEEAGLRMGRDVSVLTHDDALSYLKNGDNLPVFTATRSSVRDAGARCAEILLARVADPDAPPRTDLWEAALVVGASTGRAPQRIEPGHPSATISPAPATSP